MDRLTADMRPIKELTDWILVNLVLAVGSSGGELEGHAYN